MNKLKVMSVFGTRPEAIKMAPVVLELCKFPDAVESIVAVTAQHREMLDQVLNLFAIRPDFDLNIMSEGQTLFDITNRALSGLDKVFAEASPDVVLVHGDTTTTFAGALAAYYHQIEVGHVEAGLRTQNKFSPYPEEMNRRLTGSLADLHFAPTATAKQNLLREGVDAEKIFVTGNTVIDALYQTVRADFNFPDELSRVDFDKRVILVTTHRRENLGEPMRHVYKALKNLVDDFSDVQIIFPVHKNPKVREVVAEELGGMERVFLTDPLDYEPFANLMNRATLILTDSGGVQEEAPALGKPVLVLRDTTERPEAVHAGTVKLIGTDQEKVYGAAKILLTDAAEYRRMAEARSPYGDGHASERIVKALLWRHKFFSARPTEFNE
ncbi:MAG: UDP-N-acetylglucosamine 2-epimerase (non-hydrolyzing) [Selenomonadaceae bacterium]|nr:UDP-N-acetylglucosamine 2-epimerase (non-hydrolyzing) [Selenomonadaceae bacterium]